MEPDDGDECSGIAADLTAVLVLPEVFYSRNDGGFSEELARGSDMRILSAGLVYCDIVLSPVPGDIMKMDNSVIAPAVMHTGGDALNVAVVLAKLGMQVSLAGKIGGDMNGSFVKRELIRQRVDTEGILVDPSHDTAVSYVLVGLDGERHFLSECSINEAFRSRDVPDEMIENADMVYFGSALAMTGMPDSETADLFCRAHQRGKITAMDASVPGILKEQGKSGIELLKDTMQETDIFIPSYEEAVFLSGETEIERIIQKFEGFRLKVFGIKLGSGGCVLTDFKEQVRLSVYPELSVVDTTGAGDCFMGGFLCGYLHGWDLRKAGCFACAVSAFGIQEQGASEGVPDFETVLRYMEKYGGLL